MRVALLGPYPTDPEAAAGKGILGGVDAVVVALANGLARRPDVMEKLRVAEDRIVDGHAPGLTGKDLNAYLTAGVRTIFR